MAGTPDFERIHEEREGASRRADDDRRSTQAALEAVAGDHSGTPLEDYLPADEVRMAEDFLKAQGRRTHPDSGAFKFEELLMKVAERRFTRKRWAGTGYSIGRLSIVGVGGVSDVILCVDGTLRCERHHYSMASMFRGATPRFSGYGRLPDPGSPGVKLTTGFAIPHSRGEGGGFTSAPLTDLLTAIAEGRPMDKRPRDPFGQVT